MLAFGMQCMRPKSEDWKANFSVRFALSDPNQTTARSALVLLHSLKGQTHFMQLLYRNPVRRVTVATSWTDLTKVIREKQKAPFFLPSFLSATLPAIRVRFSRYG